MKRSQTIHFLLLGATIALVLFVRLRLLTVPLERDEGEYAYAGQLMKQGVPPYSGVYNMKFPGTYFFFFLIETVFGETTIAIHIGSLLANLACVIFIYLIGRKFFIPFAATASAISFALLSVSSSVQGLDSNTEHFVLLFALPGILLLFKAFEKLEVFEKNHRSGLTHTHSAFKLLPPIFFSGIFLGTAVIMKQHGAVFALFGAVLLLHYFIKRKRNRTNKFSNSEILRFISVFFVGIILPFILTVIVLAKAGVLKNFWGLTFLYAKEYIIENTDLKIAAQDLWFWFKPIYNSDALLWLIGLAGIVLLLLRRERVNSFFLIVFFIFSFLAISPGFYFRPHYFILLLPAASLLVGSVFHFLCHGQSSIPCPTPATLPATADGGRLSMDFRFPISIILLVSAMGIFIIVNFSYLFLLTPYEVSKKLYPTEPFTEAVDVSTYIKDHSEPMDKIVIIGSEPELYFYSKCRAASGFIYLYPLLEDHKYNQEMRKQFFSEIEYADPEYYVFFNTLQYWENNNEVGNRIASIVHSRANATPVYTLNSTQTNVSPRCKIEIYKRK